ncbi:hypothetical protein UFOVP112_333 [uncultured Caudovirales phage]|uniref:Uncharacterized protein n=1 Tax=uncultured Caudovirales phage TaxID=2100421 RepID=A0A6J5L5N1_9CAUD|nr:hypothetical protein UFOVP112_333 [uncultured Caudovirales phage]
MKLEIGTKIRWVSAAGKLSGEIVNIVLSLNAAGKVVPWIDIRPTARVQLVRLCGTDEYLKQMKVRYLDSELVA